MGKRRRRSAANVLPAEMWIQILIRLPLESVLACRRVCKSWNNLILQPFFAHLHRSSSPTPPPSFTLICNPSQLNLTTYGFITADPKHKFRYNLNFPGKVIPDVTDLEIVGSCNGLICLSSFDQGYYEEHYPDSCCSEDCFRLFLASGSSSLVQLPDPPQSTDHIAYGENIGFGYIPSTDQYKVVKIIYDEKQSLQHVVHVCTIQRGGGGITEKEITTAPPSVSAWRRIVCDDVSDQSGLPKLTGFYSSPTFYKGSIIWEAERKKFGRRQALIYYDLEKEEMGAFRLPRAILNDNTIMYSQTFAQAVTVGVYYDDDGDDHLYLCEEHETCSKIWMMDDYKSVDSFELKWVVPVPLTDGYGLRKPLKLFRVHKDGRLLIGIDKTNLAYYNPTTGETKHSLHFHSSEIAFDIPNLLGCLM